MLTEICQYLHNYFDVSRYYGKFEIVNGEIEAFNDEDIGLVNGQFFRIIGSLFNDGVHRFPDTELLDETFDGAIWGMAIPPAVLSLSEEIEAWQTKYGGANSLALSPYQSESFSGYSYSKSSVGDAESGGGFGGWQSAFAYRLKSWRKLP